MKKVFLTVIGMSLLTGCFFGRSPESNFFLLSSLKNTDVISTNKVSILVDTVIIPDLIYKPQIVLQEKDSSKISISEYNRWAEPLPDMLRQTIVDDLQGYLPNAYIKPLLFTTDTSSYSYKISVEINHFIGVFDGTALLDAWWTVKNKNNEIVLKEKARFETKLSDTYQNYVTVQSEQLSKLSKQIAERLIK